MRDGGGFFALLRSLSDPMARAHNAPSAGYRPPPVSAGDYLANPGAFPSVDAARPSLFDPPPPAMARRPMGEPVPRSVPIGPGGVIGAMEPATPAALQRHERLRSSLGEFGAQAGQLAAASRFQPRYSQPDPDAAMLREQFGGRAPVIGPGGLGGASASHRAAAETGVAPQFLDTLVEHESGGDDNAQAGTSSASGAAQFTKGTWLRMLRQHGPAYGLPAGLPENELLSLRNNRNWAALMTAEYARENEQTLTRALRRPITQREAYIGHFLGADDAADLIAASDARMGDARRFVSAEAVRANPQVFYEGGNYEWRTHPQTGRRYQHYLGGGRARTAREVVELQGRRFQDQPLR